MLPHRNEAAAKCATCMCSLQTECELRDAGGLCGEWRCGFSRAGRSGQIQLCCLYRKGSERRLIQLMKPSNSNSVKCIIESLLSFSSFFFLFSLLPLFTALCLLCLPYPLYLYIFFFFLLSLSLFHCSPSLCSLAVPQMNKQRLQGKRGCL